MIFTNDLFYQEAVRRLMLTPGQAGIDNNFINTVADVELVTNLVPDVTAQQKNFLIYYETIPVAANTPYLRWPVRSYGEGLRHCFWIDSSGNREKLDLFDEEDLEDIPTTALENPSGIIISGQQLRLEPPPLKAGSLYWSYPFRPNALTTMNLVGQVTAVDQGTQTVTLTSFVIHTAVPTAFTPFTVTTTATNLCPANFVANVLYDVIDHQSGNGILMYDQAVSAVGSNTVTFVNPIPNIAVGNWIALAGQSPVPMIPEDIQVYLLELTVARIAQARGQDSAYQMALGRLQSIRQRLPKILHNRETSKPMSLGGGSPFVVTTGRVFS